MTSTLGGGGGRGAGGGGGGVGKAKMRCFRTYGVGDSEISGCPVFIFFLK